MNNSSRDQPRGFKGRCKLSQANQATGGVNMFHTLGVRQWFAWGSHQCQTGAPRLETWVSFGSPINSSTQTHLFNLIQGSNTYSCTSNKHWLRILMFVLHDTWQKKSNPRTEELVHIKYKEKTLTFVFAAIQLEVSLSSSHFLIHFFSHC